jgi:hypothetical protein
MTRKRASGNNSSIFDALFEKPENPELRRICGEEGKHKPGRGNPKPSNWLHPNDIKQL